MKKLFSLALISILLLNVMGYYGVFLGMQYQHDTNMLQRFDSDSYEPAETITISIPLSVAYMSDQASFERVDGLFEHNGAFYRMVKQKYAKDTLTVICVRDFENQRIRQALSDYVKTFSDKPADNQNSKITISFIKDYIAQTFSIKSIAPGWSAGLHQSWYRSNLIPTFSPSITHPPERG